MNDKSDSVIVIVQCLTHEVFEMRIGEMRRWEKRVPAQWKPKKVSGADTHTDRRTQPFILQDW